MLKEVIFSSRIIPDSQTGLNSGFSSNNTVHFSRISAGKLPGTGKRGLNWGDRGVFFDGGIPGLRGYVEFPGQHA